MFQSYSGSHLLDPSLFTPTPRHNFKCSKHQVGLGTSFPPTLPTKLAIASQTQSPYFKKHEAQVPNQFPGHKVSGQKEAQKLKCMANKQNALQENLT
jgi:hypothetical protein